MTTALASRPSPSLYSGMMLALIVLALALQASFVIALAAGRAGFVLGPIAAAPAGLRASAPAAPCAIP